MLKQERSHYLVLFLSMTLYIVIGYAIPRYETLPLFLCYFSVFGLYLWILQLEDYKFWLMASVAFRAVLLFSVPALSDDFYRFIWDGRLLTAGIHPFAEVPSYYMGHPGAFPGIDPELFNKLNSKETFTIYPPVAQFIFWLSVKLSTGSVYSSMVVMKLILFAFELGTLSVFPKVMRQFNVAPKSVLVYALNPLVILELTGNLHFEGVMIFFLLVALLFLGRQQQFASAVAWSFAICTKLIPLLFLPVLVRYLGWQKAIAFWLITAVFTIALFLPLLNADIINGLSTSIGYYFQRFEFNASLYYIVRWLGYLIAGFNIIQVSGPLLAAVATIAILRVSFRKLPETFPGAIDTSIFDQMLWCLLAYFLCTTILHPWYILTLFAVSLLTPYRFTVLWTAMIFLTYTGYTQVSFHENLFAVAIEYIVVMACLLYEMVWIKSQRLSL